VCCTVLLASIAAIACALLCVISVGFKLDLRRDRVGIVSELNWDLVRIASGINLTLGHNYITMNRNWVIFGSELCR
jgi:hypothetical protein